MKQKIIILSIILLGIFQAQAQNIPSIDEAVYLKHIADLSEKANYATVAKSRWKKGPKKGQLKYPNLVEIAENITKTGNIGFHQTRYQRIIPESGGVVNHITMRLSSDTNRDYLGGRFLDANNFGHYIIHDTVTGEYFVAECLNPIKKITLYAILRNGKKPPIKKSILFVDEVSATHTNSLNVKDKPKKISLSLENRQIHSLAPTINNSYSCLNPYTIDHPDLFEKYVIENNLVGKTYYEWRSGYNIDMFDVLPRKERLALLKCLTGKTRVGRNLGWFIGGGTVFATGVAILANSLLKGGSSKPNFGGVQTQ